MHPSPPPGQGPADEPTPAEVRRRTRRAFLVWGAGGLAAVAGFRWLSTRRDGDGIPWPLRWAHEANARLGQAAFGPTRLAPTFAPSDAGDPKANGVIGQPADDAGVRILIEQPGRAVREFSPAEMVAGLPRIEQTTELKCIEGWSQVVTWGGVRFADFVAKLGTDAARHPYVAAFTHDEEYYVGLDAASAMHPQTLLCDRMNGEPLPPDHGGPLRLILTVKYGIKNLKWLAGVRFQDERPADYWAERGYDWYSGL